MPPAAAVSVDDDLATGEAGVALRAPGDEASGWIDVELRVLVEQLRRYDRSDDVFDHGVGEIAMADRRRVLRGDDDGLRAHGALAFVLDGHLRFAVWAQEIELVGLAHFRQAPRQLVREHDRQRHQLRRFTAGEAEHHPLVAGAAGVDALRDVGRLRVDR